jgi:hypothetical protein
VLFERRTVEQAFCHRGKRLHFIHPRYLDAPIEVKRKTLRASVAVIAFACWFFFEAAH